MSASERFTNSCYLRGKKKKVEWNMSLFFKILLSWKQIGGTDFSELNVI